MEFVNGSNLSKMVKSRGPLPILTAVNATIDAARGLAYAHSQGVIHRDIKPSNLLMDNQKRVKVLDLGLARLAPEDNDPGSQETATTALTATGAVMGTVDYMAPEQALNSHNADERSDIYGLGCTLYHLLTGELMYSGSTVMETLVAHREKPIPNLIEVRESVPKELQKVFTKMVAKAPEDRYESMTDVIHALEACSSEFGYSWMMRRLIDENRARG